MMYKPEKTDRFWTDIASQGIMLPSIFEKHVQKVCSNCPKSLLIVK